MLKVKDIIKMGFKSSVDPIGEMLGNMVKQTKASSGLIWNSFKELEEPEVKTVVCDILAPSFLIPFPKHLTASSSSLLDQDRTVFPWLDDQQSNSVVYVSFGSSTEVEEKDFLEIAHGLVDSKQLFLWVVRPGFVKGSTWIEPLPDGLVGQRGRIVKWAPQQEVLAHEAVGAFWTHNGWNSTLESICEGVPMICSPFYGDQPLNARYMSDVLKVGVYLENGWTREEIGNVVRRVMVDKERECKGFNQRWIFHHIHQNMEAHGKNTTLRRIILFPLPFQGHINPMFQLANILHTQGFKITIIHTQYNSPNHSTYPQFKFRSIEDRFSEVEHQLSTNRDPSYFIKYLNRSCEDPFRNCLIELLDEEPVACLISDAMFYFTQAVADDLKLPRMVLRTSSLGCAIAYGALPFSKEGRFNLTKKGYEALVPEFPLMKGKDMLKIAINPEGYGDLVTNMLKQMKASSGLIWNTFKELEESELETINQDFSVPSFTLGPFHKYFPASSSSLIDQDRNIISWLDTQPPKSVIYTSFGSVARITDVEFQEVAHSLANMSSPFLWVVRPGMVHGSEWIESLPEKFIERVGDRGRVVKWCPQQEVLAHPATGCFWTHNGWNSTLESICEGVPMICSPCFADQPIVARYVSDVWKIGILLEDGFDRVGIAMAIRRIMMDIEGEEMRERITCLKEKVNLSLDKDGSSHKSLKSLTTVRRHWRIILFPFPFQGHINPMLQLANLLYSKGFNLEEQVMEFPLLKVKDVKRIGIKSIKDPYAELILDMVKQTKASSGIIWNSFKELEETELERVFDDFPAPCFLIPFPKYFTASSSSLLEQDRTIFPWLDEQPSKSVLYVSFGSISQVDEKEFLEIAHGIVYSKQPFLWVVRPGFVKGSTWVESLPDGFLGERGRIVKWAPQQEVLAFWTHSGWNSTLESVCEGVAMICSSFWGDQPLDARYMSDVSRVGVYLENGLQREEIASAIRRIMVDEERKEIRERARALKQKANVSVMKGGSSNESIESLVDYISALIVLFPMPFQGHINPMFQLANILYTQGFKITIIHAQYNSPNHSTYPHFSFRSINERFSEVEHMLPTNRDVSFYLKFLNRSCVDPFRDCLIELLDEEPIACLIVDAMFYFTQAVADDLKLPRMVLRTSSLGCTVAYSVLPFFSKEDQGYEALVPEYPLMKVKDVLKIAINPQGYGDVVTDMLKQMTTSCGIIWNTFKELEELELETINKGFPVPSFTLGPLHKYFPASSSSLIKQDRTVLSWLDKQAPKSVIYVSFGSVARIAESEFQEVAHGLESTSSPFLWVVRPGTVLGSEWVESLPEKFIERVSDRGRVVKWCPQQDVLAHPAIGCFWTHSGWNSTLESICEGVPMICSPCFTDQPIIARYVSDVWKIGVLLEDGFERVGIEMAIKKIMIDKEGKQMRERIHHLKEKLNLSLDEGGSSNKSLKSLYDYNYGTLSLMIDLSITLKNQVYLFNFLHQNGYISIITIYIDNLINMFSCVWNLFIYHYKICNKHLPITMDNQPETTVRHHQRIILFPLPFQGHINPMLQLANLLYSKGFSITILHTNFNAPKISNYPHFTFKSILDNGPENERFSKSSLVDFAQNFIYKQEGVDALRDELELLLASGQDERVLCLITDALWHFTQSVADSLNLPRLVLRTTSVYSTIIYSSIPLLDARGYFTLDNSHLEEQMVEFPLLKVKDILKIGIKSSKDPYAELIGNMVKQMKASSGIIWNSFKELEETELERVPDDFPVPRFLIPFPKYFTASSSSLLEQDRTIFPWLDEQPPKSVVYVSFGSLTQVEEREFLEIAHGLVYSKQPFLWVVRPGFVKGSTWLESLPKGFPSERGRVVEWAPQQEVLAHEATGVFWTHSGWNSTLESVCEGVPMICSSFWGDQPLDARYMSGVSMVGVYLENGFQREEIASAIRRIMVDEEGKAIRESARVLKLKADVSVMKGGSSNESMESLVDYISSL
ncbi:hypothetical protein M8C21_000514 [Ambrosia artemisiifolia]|uniref:UDP-glucuronosyl/UDP-glucosyltransferase n=1 Tax=Ambrosia artemisiifolia TaxID=4212 RepID=A0AAD5CDZ3_AMBAR|nr:hypothetical protein M8C21_000514 [Ambrosia artemisiifolia]